jgi:hypothetical protein
MCDFYLPAGSNPERAEPKVDKKRGKRLIFVYRLVEIQGVRNQK